MSAIYSGGKCEYCNLLIWVLKQSQIQEQGCVFLDSWINAHLHPLYSLQVSMGTKYNQYITVELNTFWINAHICKTITAFIQFTHMFWHKCEVDKAETTRTLSASYKRKHNHIWVLKLGTAVIISIISNHIQVSCQISSNHSHCTSVIILSQTFNPWLLRTDLFSKLVEGMRPAQAEMLGSFTACHQRVSDWSTISSISPFLNTMPASAQGMEGSNWGL